MSLSTITHKILAFEYLIDLFIDWHNKETKTEGIPEDFTILKLVKLNFFATAVTSSPSNEGLLKLFNNYYAMPLGHVESDVYRYRGKLKKYEFDGMHLKLKSNHSSITDKIYFPIENYLEELDNSVFALQLKSSKLVLQSPMKLVDISHRWHSWIYTYRKARQSGIKSSKIDNFQIQQDIKFFTL